MIDDKLGSFDISKVLDDIIERKYSFSNGFTSVIDC